MRRAGIFAILTLLLLAVAGVTLAQEGAFKGDQQDGGATESTSPDRRSTEPESTVPEKTSKMPNDENRSLKEDKEKAKSDKVGGASQAKAVDSPKPKEERKNTAEKDTEKTSSAVEEKGEPQGNTETEKEKVKDMSSGGANGKSEGKGKAEDTGKSEDQGEDEDETDSGGGQEKVTLCYKGKNTITVGAPAQDVLASGMATSSERANSDFSVVSRHPATKPVVYGSL